MSIIEKAISWALSIANDNSHGYDQAKRWGPDYDCSSLVISAFETAGVPVKSKGATYTGNMQRAFLACGFENVIEKVNVRTGAGLIRGDVLLNTVSHTAIYLGNGTLVHAAWNEKGKALGGATGDQTGREICTRSYYNSPWDAVLRYKGDSGNKELAINAGMLLLKPGSTGGQVRALQAILRGFGYDCGEIDGEFGENTRSALCRYQEKHYLKADGECGAKTWSALLGV